MSQAKGTDTAQWSGYIGRRTLDRLKEESKARGKKQSEVIEEALERELARGDAADDEDDE